METLWSPTVANFLVAMVAIVNPIGKIPIWLSASDGDDHRVSARLAAMLVGTAFLILFAALAFGRPLLESLGIDLAAFRIGGGVVILRIGLSMLDGGDVELGRGESDGDLEPYEQAKARFRHVVVPLSVPILAGPGSISTAIVYGSKVSDYADLALLGAVLALVMLGVLVVLLSSPLIRAWVGDMALEVQTRLFGIVLAALAAQLIVEGLGEVFPTWLDAGSPIDDDVREAARQNGG